MNFRRSVHGKEFMSDTYYLRSRGKVLGPFPLDRLQTMKTRGQLGRTHQVSTDRQTWVAASALPELFAQAPEAIVFEPAESEFVQAEGEPSAVPASHGSGPNAPSAAWFYHVGGQQLGPASAMELRRLLTSGELGPEDMVWREGMESWAAIEDVPELKPRATLAAGRGNPSSDGGTIAVPTSGLAITSMVLGILGLFLPCLGLLIGILAVIFGGISLGQINRSRGRVGGRGMAITGLVTGLITLTLYGLYILLAALGTLTFPNLGRFPG